MSITAIIAFALCMFVATLAFSQMTEEPVTTTCKNLLYFKGISDKAGNTLFWETSDETNTSYFSVERSRDQANWEEVSKLKGEGMVASQVPYSWKDDSPYPGTAYYRLKEVFADGRYAYSESIMVEGKNQLAIEIYPNPAEGMMKVTVLGKENEYSQVVVRNMMGQELFRANVVNNYPVEIDIQYFPAGLYLVETIGANGMTVHKLIKK